MRLAVIGCGYVGLVSGACLAARGHDVTCVDLRAEVVAQLNDGRPHIHERGLAALLRQLRGAGRFRASTDLGEALSEASLAMLAVGTPCNDGAIDLRQVGEAADAIGCRLAAQGGFLPVVVKSTVVPGTTDGFVRARIAAALGYGAAQAAPRFGLGMNPEFLREGDAVEDFMRPDRIVLGYEDTATLAALEELYAPWDCDKLRVNTRTAELIKYANNFFLATQISATNEIANLAAAIGGIDAMEVMRGVHLDRRWNPVAAGRRVAPPILSYLVPGCGFGGSCLPKDVQALRTLGRGLGLPMRIADAVLATNDAQPGQVVDMLVAATGDLAGRKCLVLGLAFKPDTDDVRESASLGIVRDLLARGARVLAHDPVAAANFSIALGADAALVGFVADWRAALVAAEIVIVATCWAEYAGLADAPLAGRLVFDARRMFVPGAFAGARYLAIGKAAG